MSVCCSLSPETHPYPNMTVYSYSILKESAVHWKLCSLSFSPDKDYDWNITMHFYSVPQLKHGQWDLYISWALHSLGFLWLHVCFWTSFCIFIVGWDGVLLVWELSFLRRPLERLSFDKSCNCNAIVHFYGILKSNNVHWDFTTLLVSSRQHLLPNIILHLYSTLVNTRQPAHLKLKLLVRPCISCLLKRQIFNTSLHLDTAVMLRPDCRAAWYSYKPPVSGEKRMREKSRACGFCILQAVSDQRVCCGGELFGEERTLDVGWLHATAWLVSHLLVNYSSFQLWWKSWSI